MDDSPPKQTRLKGPERRNRFLDAAAEIVIEQGVSAVTMDGVAARSGVNKALGYRYFCGRDDLLDALFDREVQRHASRVEHEISRDASFEAWVRYGLRHWFRRMDESGELFLRLTSDNGPLAAKAAARRQADAAAWAQGLRRVFGISERPAQHLAAFLVAGTAGALSVRNGQDDEAVIETITVSILAAAEALKAREVR
ncbi:MAG: TetR/AcrR family transcriptional regulator [Alphaproteobacteria bacterium]|nr:TetR/AcrR family transcriptional regulator [Alphaproteobacteria bacterium]MBU1515979.1 TetR/AcrR family transcriptional regulator [Alphaproteobacteria bacterium]MBU2092806.1 TetR/AcrR family transcriptional regulator [Alphaproteobacteria bacterium]MBU2153669.1 TetR/AcrR family transcriptional regulator [Alphaproteobacteria bacterium]MBU2308297.1 TetR/AcrR family transcriptional regulator [Alphaproteobacteria bacterium]